MMTGMSDVDRIDLNVSSPSFRPVCWSITIRLGDACARFNSLQLGVELVGIL